MIFTELTLNGAYLVELKKLEDHRGFFARAFCQREFEQQGLNPRLVQCNISFNPARATLRGIHYQRAPYAEVKLVRCTRGAIYDVIIDLRPGSTTYRQWQGIGLSADNRRMLYVPEGFAHGYLSLADESEVLYQVSEFYSSGAESGIRWNDPAFAIRWPIEPRVISAKDRAHPDFTS
jgi:dTDP-4-dehydrorhamnose 3,5-epimerase